MSSPASQPTPPSPPPPAPALDARGLPIGYSFKPDWEVTPRQTRDAIRSEPNTLLLDCRRLDEHQLTRIEGAVHIPMDQIERRADELVDDDDDKSRPIIVHCHHGMRSLRVAATLRAMGFSQVRSMAGGIDLWSIDIDPAVKRY